MELDQNQSATLMNVAMLFQTLICGFTCTSFTIADCHFEEKSFYTETYPPKHWVSGVSFVHRNVAHFSFSLLFLENRMTFCFIFEMFCPLFIYKFIARHLL